MVSMKIHKIGIAHHLKALRAGAQAGNQFSSRIGYKYLKEGSKMKYDKIGTGVNLRQLRIENKLSAGEVSDIVDKSESHIMQLERGSRNLTVEMLCKFADLYNTDPNTILGISSQRMVVMIDKLKSLPVETSEQLIRTFISVIDSLDVFAGGGNNDRYAKRRAVCSNES